ncbi:MAG: Gfo/Idh/MocA family oxidoreductase [Chloroflexi bacterium]|nr:MAG: Gfo/Idh/MocA family oxidoreductase [Chloroflexota bacterium]
MAKLRLGVIGAGSWTVSSHLPNLERWRDVLEFTIVNRRNAELLDRIKGKFGFRLATTRWEDVIAEHCDIVVVGTPVGKHHLQTKAALEAGSQVLCEKPFTIDPADAWDLVDVVRRTGKDVVIAYGWNYRPMVIQAHQLMHGDGGVGDIEQVTIHMASATRELLSETGSYPDADPELIPAPATWSRPETSGGGYAQAQLTHALGVVLWLTGLRGQSVFAFMSAPLRAKVELHDAISIRYTNGAIGTLGGGSAYTGAGNNRHQLYIRAIGSLGQLMVDLERNVLWRYRSPDDDITVPLDQDAGLYDCRGPVDAVVLAGLGRPYANNSPAELGARTVEILAAAYRSAKSGRVEQIST